MLFETVVKDAWLNNLEFALW